MEQIGCGCTRKVYKLNDTTVLKIPYNECGQSQARQEYELYQNDSYKPYLAEIYSYDEVTGQIEMELLTSCGVLKKQIAIENNIFPDYVLERIDGDILQVGRDKNGNIKIFDYGIEHINSDVFKTYFPDVKDEFRRYALRKFKLDV